MGRFAASPLAIVSQLATLRARLHKFCFLYAPREVTVPASRRLWTLSTTRLGNPTDLGLLCYTRFTSGVCK